MGSFRSPCLGGRALGAPSALACAALAACASLFACAPPPGGDAGQDPEEVLAQPQSPLETGEHPHLMPVRRDGPRAASAGEAGPRLRYYGGHVISHVRVAVVFWGANVDPTTQARIGAFYRAVVDSPYFDWLSEYDTDRAAEGGQPGTGQHIGRGSYAGSFAIAPQASGDVTNDEIQAELSRQIAAGTLPADDGNTLYMIYFPPGVAISLPDGNGGQARSCQQFCAFHNTMRIQGRSVYYGVLPDLGSDLMCMLGCGKPFDTFNNLTSASSHELIEAVTDAEVGLAQSEGPPLGWYDFSKDAQGNERGEIGDICNGQRGSATGRDGSTWAVQKEWSNRDGACIDARGSEPQPPHVVLTAPREGARVSGVVAISATATAAAGATVRALELFVDGAKVGGSASGQATVSWDAGQAADGAHVLLARATDSAGRTGASDAVHVEVHGAAKASERVRNGGFEGSLAHWTLGGKKPIDSVVKAHSGRNSLRCGATPAVKPDGDSFAFQAVAIPADAKAASLSFWSWSQIADAESDFVEALLRDETGAPIETVFHRADNSQEWKRSTFDLSAFRGRTIQIYFNAHGIRPAPATMWVDDVSVQVRR